MKGRLIFSFFHISPFPDVCCRIVSSGSPSKSPSRWGSDGRDNVEVLITILLIVLVLAVFLIRAGLKANKALKQNVIDIGADDVFLGFHVEGLGIAKNEPCKIFSFKDRILIDAKSQKFEIPYDRIRAAVVQNEREIIEKGKSVVGRAVIGTLLLPGLGTIVGGMTGIGNKKKNGALNHFLIFNYLDTKGEMQGVTFLNNYAEIKMHNFSEGINKRITITSPDVVVL